MRAGSSVQVPGRYKGPVDEGVALVGNIAGEDADLAVGDLARRAGVLPADPTGRLALLEEAGLVDDKNRLQIGKRFDHVVAHDIAQSIGIPAGTTKHGLLTPGTGIAGGFRPPPARLAPLRPERRIQEQPCRMRHALLQKQRPDPLLHISQRRRPELQRRLNGNACHP
jgi:hypothetical protein